jgi:hypothetical protein
MYVFTDLHEAFFCYFPELLQEWILSLKDTHPTNQIRLLESTTESIARLERVNNKFTNSGFMARQYYCRVYY